jgi:hypothetical protein
MPTKTIHVYEIRAIFTIRKEDWELEESRCGQMTESKIRERIESGIELPIENIKISVKK